MPHRSRQLGHRSHLGNHAAALSLHHGQGDMHALDESQHAVEFCQALSGSECPRANRGGFLGAGERAASIVQQLTHGGEAALQLSDALGIAVQQPLAQPPHDARRLQDRIRHIASGARHDVGWQDHGGQQRHGRTDDGTQEPLESG
ncbi:hypothetical protein SDC9_93217 [bioreactor metagenome]|uniref:Uncharacterized protein n=1 Tax=bioreactor metagenome TaxID=1076179 RepID=A0A645A9W0_9ZZZZ